MASRKEPANWLVPSLAVIVVLALTCLGLAATPSSATSLLRVTFLDVGQGDAAWLNTPEVGISSLTEVRRAPGLSWSPTSKPTASPTSR